MKKSSVDNQPKLDASPAAVTTGVAAIPAVPDQPKPKEAAVETRKIEGYGTLTLTLPERLKAAWENDLLAVDKWEKAGVAYTTAEGIHENASLVLGKVLLEVLNSVSHGGLTEFVKANIGDSKAITHRCQYCLDKAKKATGWVKPVIDPVVAAQAKLMAKTEVLATKLKEKQDVIAAAVAANPPGNVHPVVSNPQIKETNAQALAIKAKMDKLAATGPDIIEKVRLDAELDKVNGVAKVEVKASKETLDGDVARIVVKLKNLVKVAKDDKQLRMDFTGDADSIKADVDKLVVDATACVTKRIKMFGTKFDTPGVTAPTAKVA